MRKIVLATRNTVIRTPTRDRGNRNEVCLITEVKAAACRLCSHARIDHHQLHVQNTPGNSIQENTFHDTVNLHSTELYSEKSVRCLDKAAAVALKGNAVYWQRKLAAKSQITIFRLDIT